VRKGNRAFLDVTGMMSQNMQICLDLNASCGYKYAATPIDASNEKAFNRNILRM